jgi:hypothetical protein
VGNGEQVLLQKKTGYLLYYDTRKLLTPSNSSRRFESSVAINGKTYSSVLIFECASEDKCVSTSITKFYFSKTRGLVAFVRNNITWTIR